MVSQQTLIGALADIAGEANAREPGPEAAVDGLSPRAMVRPGTYEETAAVLRLANERGLAVIPWGNGTLMHIGNVPACYDIALDLTRLDRIIEHEPADLTVTCQAGITLGALREQMASSGQTFPIDPSLPDEATVGGILAVAAYGPARPAYGAPRDFTIGMRVATADGRITRAGGKVVKNVAGYDLCKLYTGSFGTLGVILEATFKALPLPVATGSFAATFESPRDACSLAAEAQRRGLTVRGAAVTTPLPPGEPAVLLSVDLAGSRAGVERSAAELDEMVPAYGGTPADSRPPRTYDAPAFAIRADVLATALPGLFDHFRQIDGGAYLSALPTTGTIRASWAQVEDPAALLPELRQGVSSAGGTLIVERCPAPMKSEIDVFGDIPPSFPLMRAIKQQFDPSGVLSPGRFLGHL